jgi:hypothetical protein
MIGRARAAWWIAILGLAGCPPPPVARPYPPPTVNELLAALRARQTQVRSLRANAKVDALGDGGQRGKVKVAMLVERGGKLRFEVDSPLGGTLAYLTSDGERFALLDVRQNRFLVGPANACNVGRLIRVTLPPDDIVEALLGGAPLDGEPAPGGVGWDPSHGGREVLTLRAPDGGSETIELDARDRRWDLVSATRKDAAGKLLWRISDGNFQDRGGIRMPETIHVEDPPHKADAIIKFRSQEPNAQIDESLFRLQPPEGIAPEEASCS